MDPLLYSRVKSAEWAAADEPHLNKPKAKTAPYGNAETTVPPRQCTVSQINGKNGQIV